MLFIVPGFLNKRRTNNAPDDEFCLSDFRFNGTWRLDSRNNFISDSNGKLTTLITNRTLDSMVWIQHTVLEYHPEFTLVLDDILTRFRTALAYEKHQIKMNFVDKNGLNDQGEAIIAFLNKLLIQARQADLNALKGYRALYNSLMVDNSRPKSLVSQDYAVSQASLAAAQHIKTANQLIQLLNSEKFKFECLSKHDSLTKQIQEELHNMVTSNLSNNLDFKLEIAQNGLKEFQSALDKNHKITNDLSLQELKNTCNNNLQLGNNYKNDG